MAFQQGLSGLNGAAKNLDVIGNNIANTSTVGFKSSRTEFADVYATSLFGLSNMNVGIGSKLAAVTQQFNQGNISATNSPLDIAISGEGFFQLVQGDLTTYTRNGQFQMDKNGFIVDSSGRNLTGNLADSTGTIVGGPPVPLQVSLGVVAPKQTTLGHLTANLNYTAEVPTGAALGAIPPATPINPSTPSSYNYSTTVNIYDAAGTAQGLSLYFQKASTGQWNVAGYVNGTQVLPTNHVNYPGATAATMSFDLNGKLLAINDNNLNALAGAYSAAATALQTGVPPSGGASAAQVQAVAETAVAVAVAGTTVTPAQLMAAAEAMTAADAASGNAGLAAPVAAAAKAARSNLIANPELPLFDSPGSFFNLDLTKMTQYGSTSGVSYVSQDGYSAGQFSNLNVDQTGLVQGIYTNGRTLNLGQIQLTSFLNPHGLQPLGDNQWAETGTSGKQNSDAPGNGLLGYLQSGSVEESNVDLTSELVNLIVAQRMYQANAQTISAQSTVLQTLVNLR